MTFGRKKFPLPIGLPQMQSKMKKKNNVKKTQVGPEKVKRFKNRPRKILTPTNTFRPLEPNYGKPGYKRPESLLPLLEHQDRFIDCSLCPISNFTSQKVFYRGTFPPRFLFIGEAPGESEDAIGLPFVGRSGRLFDKLLYEANIGPTQYGITNSILCTPYTDASKKTIRTPNPQELTNCRSHLSAFLDTCNPVRIIALGKVAASSLKKLKIDFLELPHPAAMLRGGGEESILFARAVLDLKEMVAQFQGTISVKERAQNILRDYPKEYPKTPKKRKHK